MAKASIRVTANPNQKQRHAPHASDHQNFSRNSLGGTSFVGYGMKRQAQETRWKYEDQCGLRGTTILILVRGADAGEALADAAAVRSAAKALFGA
jgi:hypothetical protein